MLKIIAAVAENGVIGKGNTLPWQLYDDLKWFKEKTLGHTVVQGHNTLKSIVSKLGRPLPRRTNLVLTRNPMAENTPNVEFIPWWETILHRSLREDIFVIGGASVYELALPHTTELYLTQVHADVPGDAYFPTWNREEWNKTFSEGHTKNDRNQYDFTFRIYRRKTVA